jgi:hypothetical protein
MQHADIKTLAKRVLSRNTTRNTDATYDKKVVASGGKKDAGLLHGKLGVFEYRLAGAGPWLILLTTDPSDALETLPDRLAQRFGCCVVEVRQMKGKP